MSATKSTHDHKGLVAILGTAGLDSAALCRMIEKRRLRSNICCDLEELQDCLSECCLAAILDIDKVPLDNRTIRELTLAHPGTCFFCTSKERFHPDLKDAICYHLFACLHKPVDPDELDYFLKCIIDENAESRGPPDDRS